MFQYASLKNRDSFSPKHNHHIIIMPKIINHTALILFKNFGVQISLLPLGPFLILDLFESRSK